MDVLGVSSWSSDSAAALARDGRTVAAEVEERFTRVPADGSFPARAARACLRRGGAEVGGLEAVVLAEKPLRRFERVLLTQLSAWPRSLRTFRETLFLWLGNRLWSKNRIASELGIDAGRVLFAEHHRAAAAAAFYPSPFEEAAVLCADAPGEWTSASLWRGRGLALEPLGEVHFPHSLGLWYAALSRHLGFAARAEDPRLLELAAHGEPRRVEAVESLLRVEDDGSFALDLEPFRLVFDAERPGGEELARRLGPPRAPGDALAGPEGRRAADLAASVRVVLERALEGLARELARRSGCEDLCLAGALAVHPGLNASLLSRGPFRRLFVPPAPSEAGSALGAALHVAHAVHGAPRPPANGARASDARAPAEPHLETIARRLGEGKLVGWSRGPSEWGDRALGSQVLLAGASRGDARERAARLRRREPFRPFACAVAAEAAGELFDLPAGGEDPARSKLLAVEVRPSARERIPAAVHADGTAVVQLVDEPRDPDLHRLLALVGEESGAPVLLSSSLRMRGEPRAGGAEDARRFFERTELDLLAVDGELYER